MPAQSERSVLPNRLYLDHAATTPILPEAQAAVADGIRLWANPSSPHAEGRKARALLEEARARIAVALEWDGAVILTSGASEAAALALGRAKAGPRFVSATEHDSVRRAAGDAAVLPVSALGAADLAGVAGERPLVIVQSVNSETGVIQPAVAEGLWLADCAQSAGKLALPQADMLIVSAHKLGGPPGIGALLVRDLSLLEATGGQEQGYRGGTENLPGALGFAAALEAPRDWLEDAARWRPMLDAAIIDAGGEVIAASAPRLPTIASYRMPGVPSAAQLIRFDLAGIAVSAGSACSSGSLKPSPVLAAMGLGEAAAGEVIRVSFGWTTTEADVARFAAEWGRIARAARRSAA